MEKIKYTDNLRAINPNHTDGVWKEGDGAFPNEIELRLYRRSENPYIDGRELVESVRYQRIESPRRF